MIHSNKPLIRASQSNNSCLSFFEDMLTPGSEWHCGSSLNPAFFQLAMG